MKRTMVKGNIPLTTLNIGSNYNSFVAVNLTYGERQQIKEKYCVNKYIISYFIQNII